MIAWIIGLWRYKTWILIGTCVLVMIIGYLALTYYHRKSDKLSVEVKTRVEEVKQANRALTASSQHQVRVNEIRATTRAFTEKIHELEKREAGPEPQVPPVIRETVYVDKGGCHEEDMSGTISVANELIDHFNRVRDGSVGPR